MNPLTSFSSHLTTILSGPLSPRTESQLDYWVELKRARDFEMADKVREELRKRGIEPGNLR